MRVLACAPALAAVLLVACSAPQPPAVSTPAATHEPNTVNVSVLLDLSGKRAPSGQPQRDAMQLWLDRPPPTSTVRLRVKFVDVASSSAKLLLEVKRAVVEDRADAIVVGVSVGGDESFAAAAEVAEVPILLTLPAPEPVSAGHGGYVFALAPAPGTIARVIAGDIVDRGLVAPMLIAGDDSPTSLVERNAFVAELARRGITAPNALSITSSDGPMRIRIPATVAKSAVFTGPAGVFGQLIRPIAPGAKANVARIYLSYLTESADLAGLREISASVTWPGSRRVTGGLRGADLAPAFLAGFADRYGQPSTLAGSAYDALTLIEAAAAQSPSDSDPSRLRQRLEANTVAGAMSRYSFTSSRHVGFSTEDLVLLSWNAQTGSTIVAAAQSDR